MATALLLSAPSSSAHRLLLLSSHPELQELEVVEQQDEFILRGTVPSWYLKQLAQETIRPAVGQRRIRNCVTVQK